MLLNRKVALVSARSLTSTAGIMRPHTVSLPLSPPNVLRPQYPLPGAAPPSTAPPPGPAPGDPLLSRPPRGIPLLTGHSPSAFLLQTVADVHGNASSSIAPPREPQPGTPPSGSSLHLSSRFLPRTPPSPLSPMASPAAMAVSAQANPRSMVHSPGSRETARPAGSPLEGSLLSPLGTALNPNTHEIPSGIHSCSQANKSSMRSGAPQNNSQLGGQLPIQSGPWLKDAPIISMRPLTQENFLRLLQTGHQPQAKT